MCGCACSHVCVCARACVCVCVSRCVGIYVCMPSVVSTVNRFLSVLLSLSLALSPSVDGADYG